MKNKPLRFCFCGEEIAYRVALPAIRQYIQMLDLNNAGLIEVAIAEAVTNAVKASHDQLVVINMYVDSSGYLSVRIRDHGKGFDVAKAMDRLNEWENEIPDESLYAESGRGLWVIHQVFDQVHFNQPGNELLLIKSLSH